MNQSNNKEHDAPNNYKCIKYAPPVFPAIMFNKILMEASHLNSENKIKSNKCVQNEFEQYEPGSLSNFKPINNCDQNKYERKY